MSEYKVKFKIRATGLFGPSGESVEVYQADTGSEAIEKCKAHFKRLFIGFDEDDIEFTILDVEKL